MHLNEDELLYQTQPTDMSGAVSRKKKKQSLSSSVRAPPLVATFTSGRYHLGERLSHNGVLYNANICSLYEV